MIQRRICAFHPERPGHAACMRCRTVLCQECASSYEGIFYCAACMAARRRAAGAGRAPFGWIFVVLATLLLLGLHARAAVWAGALLAGWR
jgi:B-box zinc finger protein